ncbi:hypothetical protein B0H14DRAFT_2623300 [Mycena olivaceomarginata]|nr:hypothetical protein B0H14DRAFT_2623300 [Mycena olivaceomarginata]
MCERVARHPINNVHIEVPEPVRFSPPNRIKMLTFHRTPQFPGPARVRYSFKTSGVALLSVVIADAGERRSGYVQVLEAISRVDSGLGDNHDAFQRVGPGHVHFRSILNAGRDCRALSKKKELRGVLSLKEPDDVQRKLELAVRENMLRHGMRVKAALEGLPVVVQNRPDVARATVILQACSASALLHGECQSGTKVEGSRDVHGGEDVPGAPIYNVEDPDSGNADERAVNLLVKRRAEALAFISATLTRPAKTYIWREKRPSSADPHSKSCRFLTSNKLRNKQIVTVLSLYFAILKISTVLSSGGQAKSYWSEFISGLSNILRNLKMRSNLCDCELRHKTRPGGNCVRARQPKSIPSDLNTSEEEREYERQYARYLRKLDRYNRKQAEIQYVSEREEAQRRVHAIQNKRDQWKAASARYYERHPEVKEKKRLQAAEKRCGDVLPRSSHGVGGIPQKDQGTCRGRSGFRHHSTAGATASASSQTNPVRPSHLPRKFNAHVFRNSEEQQLGNFSDTPDIDLIPDALHARAGPYTHDDILQLWTEEEAESGGHAVDILSPQLRNGEWPMHPPAYADENMAAESLLDLRGEGSAMRAETREPPPIWASLAPEYESSAGNDLNHLRHQTILVPLFVQGERLRLASPATVLLIGDTLDLKIGLLANKREHEGRGQERREQYVHGCVDARLASDIHDPPGSTAVAGGSVLGLNLGGSLGNGPRPRRLNITQVVVVNVQPVETAGGGLHVEAVNERRKLDWERELDKRCVVEQRTLTLQSLDTTGQSGKSARQVHSQSLTPPQARRERWGAVLAAVKEHAVQETADLNRWGKQTKRERVDPCLGLAQWGRDIAS